MIGGVTRVVVVALILLLSVCLVGCGETQTDGGSLSGEKLRILSHSMTTHQFAGSMLESTAVVKGRAQNISNSTINFASITVRFYDKNGNLIDTSSAIRQNLGPGEIWDFAVQTAGPDAWKSVDYDIVADASQ